MMTKTSFKDQLRQLVESRPLIVYLIAVMIFFSMFLVNMGDINVWDETYYVNSGRLLWQGNLVPLALSPLASMLYGLTYLPFFSSPFWLLLSDGLGRFLIFSLLFWGTWSVGKALEEVPPLVPVIFLLLSPVVVANYNFPSDLLLAGFSALAFGQVLMYHRQKNIRQVWLASLFLGLAGLARAEGLVLFIVALVFIVLFSLPKPDWKKLLPAVMVPFVVLIGGYLLVYGLAMGEFETGLADRTYDNFEAGHEIIYTDSDAYGTTVEAAAAAREVFGTREENNTSVIRAIRRNPAVYFQRLKGLLRSLPAALNRAYDIRLGVVWFLLAVRGMIALARRKDIKVLFLHLAWLLPLAPVMMNTIMRDGYLRMPFIVFFSLASIGLIALLNNIRTRIEPAVWAVLLIGIAAASWFSGTTAVYYGTVLFLASLMVVYLLNNVWQPLGQASLTLSLILLMVFGLIIHGDMPGLKRYTLGESPAEQSVLFLHDQYPENTAVLSASPLPVFMARHDLYNLNSTDIPAFSDAEDFLVWVRAQDISLIYVDSLMPPVIYQFAMDLLNAGLVRVYESGSGDYQILSVSAE
jgi:hypothetical protein